MTKSDRFYKENIIEQSEELAEELSLTIEPTNGEKTVPAEKIEPLPPELRYWGFKGVKDKGGIYYISDIHLDHRIFNKFGLNGNKKKTEQYIREIAEGLIRDDDGHKIEFPFILGNYTIIILGDTSHKIELNKIFYSYLSRILPYYVDVFVILGNHELWGFREPEQAIEAYEEFFDSLPNIHLLYNALYVDNLEIEGRDMKFSGSEQDRHKSLIQRNILTSDDLTNMTVEDIRRACHENRTILFGTIGYAPYNPDFNYASGIYRDTIVMEEQEKRLAAQGEEIYKKLTLALPNNHVIVASHMTLGDWSKTPPVPKWRYFSGHTHHNKRILNETVTEYADNQVGYHNKRVKFNAVSVDEKVDIFAYYKDGTCRITDTEYRRFYFGLSKHLYSVDKRGCEKSKIIMLKNGGVYLFLLKSNSGEQLYLLEGGKRHTLKNLDIQYYYNNMVQINNILSKAVDGIRQYLGSLSAAIKRIGGSGYIHGNIVDIDTFNHVMIDVETGVLLPYYALSINDRYEFSSVPKLLEAKRPDLYERYLLTGQDLPTIYRETPAKNEIKHSEDTTIYKNSKIMLKIQDMIDYNVIRFWNDELVDIINKRKRINGGDIKSLK